MSSWRSGASLPTLEARDRLLRVVRSFFQERNVIEVQTPMLGATGVTDPHIENLALQAGSKTWYLQTSPEYAMKRLLASGSGAIFQVCPAIRGGESGERHNIEFTMLEWYRPDFSMMDLVAELVALVEHVASTFAMDIEGVSVKSYRQLFEDRYGINPHAVADTDLRELAEREAGGIPAHIGKQDEGTTDDLLDYLFSRGIETSLDAPTVVAGYPASQAALAELIRSEDGDTVAGRFELYWRGTELANGYQELRDALELEARMITNNALRRRRGLPEIPLDHQLLGALPHMPDCAGIALGIDRLLMVLTGAATLAEVLSFSDSRI